jgi:predicted TIM-barrel fold metal-dependent hydrolase
MRVHATIEEILHFGLGSAEQELRFNRQVIIFMNCSQSWEPIPFFRGVFMYRRSFIASSAIGMAGLGLRDVAADYGSKALEIIDCHTHFYDPSRPEGVPWPAKDTKLYRTVLPEHLRALKQFRQVTGTVIVEASPWVEDNQWLLDLARVDPFIVGIVGNLQLGEPDFAKLLKRFASNPLFRGIRANVSLVKQLIDKNEFADFQQLANLDLSLDVNGGPDTPAALARLASKLPTLRIILNHIGNVRITKDGPIADWKSGIAEAARHPNVFAKISGLVEGAAHDSQPAPRDLDFYRPYINVVWQAFGDQRVIYGSNWPVSERAADYETVQRLALEYAFEHGEEATRQFCSLNAMRAYQWVKRVQSPRP